MRLPFPTRISVQKTLIFAAAIFVIQIVQRTEPLFAILFFVFVLLSVLTFNYASGLSRASGFYVFWFALLTCVVGAMWKIVLGEPASSNLSSPVGTMTTYVVSMLMIFASLVVSRRMTRNARGLSGLLKTDRVNLGLASLGCLLAGLVVVVANMYLPQGQGTLIAIINQTNAFLPVAILLGTIHAIRTSGGRSSVTVVTIIASLYIFILGGMINYSKQGMFTPIVCWGAAAASQRYRLRLWQIALLIAFGAYSVAILSPLSGVGRADISDNATNYDRAVLTVDLLSNPKRLRAEYKNHIGSTDPTQNVAGFAKSYYDTPQGLMDRLAMISADDRLVNYTLQGHTDGYQRFIYSFVNWIPHFIWRDKDNYAPPGALNAGNWYAHEMGGMLSPDDYSTGISFSPAAEAFHYESWLGIILIAPIAWVLLFTVIDLICGDLRRSPYGLMAAVYFAHIAPESGVGGIVSFVWTGSIAITMAIVFCTFFAPVLGTLLSGPEDPRVSFSPAPRLSTNEI